MPEEAVDLWKDNPEVIRRFLEKREVYLRLAEEVAYILKKSATESGIKFSQVTFRVKELNSFCEKCKRKMYTNQLDECTDIAGVRIVYLYVSDSSAIDEIIRDKFNVVEVVNKLDASDPDRFGYGAIHYLVNIGDKSTGARYDELKEMLCEVQVRTILQDAWAVVGHHLTYKRESQIPKELRRKLNALAGLFEIADSEFNRVKSDSERYIENSRQKYRLGTNEFLDGVINLDSMITYLELKLPTRIVSSREDVADLLVDLEKFNVKVFRQIDSAIDSSLDAISEYERKYPPVDEVSAENTMYSRVGVVRVALRYKGLMPKTSVHLRMDEFNNLLK